MKNSAISYEKENLKRALKSRHIQMLSIGWAIGTGLFYGSSWSIKAAGPAIILSFIIGGIAIYFMMRCLGEMAVEEPISGSYISYSNRYIHRFVGFMLGWQPLVLLMAVSAAEFNALGQYVNYWFPTIPIWVSAFFVVTMMLVINVFGVALYGEMEFWFSIIKVLAIIALIVIGAMMIFFGVGNEGHPVGFANLYSHGGFFATGVSGFIISFVMVAFSFGGIENIGLAAGETGNVEKEFPKATKQVFWRILIFYIGAITVMVTLFPWNTIGSTGSPFVQVFERLHIPYAASILNLVVITAAFSSVNSGIFTNSRTFYNLSLQGNAPAFLSKVNKKQVPINALLLVFVAMFLGVIVNYILPNRAFEIFSSVVTVGLLTGWTAIIVSHYKYRKMRIQRGDAHLIKFKSPFYPYSNYISLGFMALVLVSMAFIPDMQMSLIMSIVWVIFIFGCYCLFIKGSKSREPNEVKHEITES